MSDLVQDLEDPNSKIPITKDQNDNLASDSEDEAAPDFTQLTALANRLKSKGGSGEIQDDSSRQFIPKRGEKDFEPTGFKGQKNALENSRKAMFDVIDSQRIINSKSISIAIWHPKLNRAIVHLVRGQIFASMGISKRVAILEDGQYQDLAEIYGDKTDSPVAGTMKDGVFWPKMQSRLELLPEEALYLIDRGSLECRILHKGSKHSISPIRSGAEIRDYDDENDDASWAPMSVEQAFATIIGADGLTRQHYQLYAYLKRLGYVVQRKSISDELRKASKANMQASKENVVEVEGVIADPRHPLRLLTIFDVFLYPFRRILQLASNGLTYIRKAFIDLLQWLRERTNRVTATSKKDTSMLSRPGLLGIGSTSWSSYDDIYDKLRIIPSGHDIALPKPLIKSEQDIVPEIFFYAWRPATHFKKSDPPLPEFQLAVVDARNTSLPSAFAFGDLLDQIPMPLSTQDLEEMDEEEQRVWRMAEEQKKRNNESYGRGAVRKLQAEAKAAKEAKENQNMGNTTFVRNTWLKFFGLLNFLARLFAHLPPGFRVQTKSKGRGNRQFGGRNSAVNVYVPLKAGRRNVIVAVNDCGTTSLLRFGEAEFARWRIAGNQREGR